MSAWNADVTTIITVTTTITTTTTTTTTITITTIIVTITMTITIITTTIINVTVIFHKYLLSTCSLPGTVLGARDTINKTDSWLERADILVR